VITAADSSTGTALEETNRFLSGLSAYARVAWAIENTPGLHVMTSSFGVQAAVMLHLVTQVHPGIPVVVVDTGYLFPETYQFMDALTSRLGLNLVVCRADLSPAWQEARYGKQWEQGIDGIKAYNHRNKVEPLDIKFDELGVATWFTGLRREQASSRAETPFIDVAAGRIKVQPIADWTKQDVHRYLEQYELPYHPLFEQGYVSIGDTHSTMPLELGMTEEETRFGGLVRECGLHVKAEGNA
jgi:phosphoadenosine phosphosulfate reductase